MTNLIDEGMAHEYSGTILGSRYIDDSGSRGREALTNLPSMGRHPWARCRSIIYYQYHQYKPADYGGYIASSNKAIDRM